MGNETREWQGKVEIIPRHNNHPVLTIRSFHLSTFPEPCSLGKVSGTYPSDLDTNYGRRSHKRGPKSVMFYCKSLALNVAFARQCVRVRACVTEARGSLDALPADGLSNDSWWLGRKGLIAYFSQVFFA